MKGEVVSFSMYLVLWFRKLKGIIFIYVYLQAMAGLASDGRRKVTRTSSEVAGYKRRYHAWSLWTN